MSIRLMSAVWDLDLAPGEKLVLLALADQANDEGRQCWPSVESICKRSGQGERTVRRALVSLEEKGHLTRHHREGTSTQYHVHPCQSGTPAKSAPLPKTTKTPAKLAPKTPITTITKKRASEIPANWRPEAFGEGTESQKVLVLWPPGEFERQVEAFSAHHAARANAFTDWQKAWSTWVLNSRKFGNDNRRQGNSNSNAADLARQKLGLG